MNIVSIYILCEGDSVAVVCDNCNSFTVRFSSFPYYDARTIHFFNGHTDSIESAPGKIRPPVYIKGKYMCF